MTNDKKNLEQNLDQELDAFFSQSLPPSEDFTQKVMIALPQEPRLAWITSAGPLCGGLVGILFLYFVAPLNLSTVLYLIGSVKGRCSMAFTYAPLLISQISVVTLIAVGLATLWYLAEEDFI